jgi:hypothetical protein
MAGRKPDPDHPFLTARDRLVARAQGIVWLAVKRGTLPELEGLKCVDCGEQAQCYDHRNYHEPLKVQPVCKGCNNRRGPGHPLPTEADGRIHKLDLPEGAKTAGGRWSSVEGGDGDSLLTHELPVHADISGIEIDTDESHERLSNEGMMRVHRRWSAPMHRIRTARYDWFKKRDPWCIEP